MRWLVTALSVSLLGCPHFEKNPRDVESKEIAPLSSGQCDSVAVLPVESLYKAPYELADNVPPAATQAAFEGLPSGEAICTQRGCEWECCDNSCGFFPECPYYLRVDTYNKLCLVHESYACGGTDCSPWCQPFSTEPQRRYRFVGTLSYQGKMSASLAVTAVCWDDR